MVHRYRRSLGPALAVTFAVAAFGCGQRDAASANRTTATQDVAAATLRVTKLELGKAIGPDKRVTKETDDFESDDVIYASVATEGSAPNANLTARWTFEDGQLISESSQTVSTTGTDATEFHISKPGGWPKGDYKVQIMLNGKEAESEEFEVK